jgi:hypothetical protein
MREYFGEKQQLDYQDIIDYVNSNTCYDFSLCETVVDGHWFVQAYIDEFINNTSFRVIVDTDVLSPYRNYNQIEAQRLIDKIQDKYKNIKDIYGKQ